MPAKPSELKRAAERSGFVFQHQKGSHAFYKRAADGGRVSIPVHGDRDVPTGLYFAILKPLGISEAEFRRLR